LQGKRSNVIGTVGPGGTEKLGFQSVPAVLSIVGCLILCCTSSKKIDSDDGKRWEGNLTKEWEAESAISGRISIKVSGSCDPQGYFEGVRYVKRKANGRLIQEEHFRHGNLDGIVIYHFRDILYLSNYRRGDLHGRQLSYYDEGVKKEIFGMKTYRYGILNGVAAEWYRDNILERKTEYLQGERNGTEWEWYPNGKVKRRTDYLKNMLNGMSEEWWMNGNIKSRREYKEDKEDGVSWEWFENGRVSNYAEYKSGKPDGKLRTWDENGRLLVEMTCCGGKSCNREDGRKRDPCNPLGDLKYDADWGMEDIELSDIVSKKINRTTFGTDTDILKCDQAFTTPLGI